MARAIDIDKRTFEFAVNICKLADKISNTTPSRKTLSSQIVRSGTSIGANIEEAQAAESKADFIHKYSIALKEARETRYWLRLLVASNTGRKEDLTGLTKEIDEVCRIIAQIIINARK